MWSGYGSHGMFIHDNLDEVTHQRLADLLGAIHPSYHEHIAKCVRAGRLVKFKNDPNYFPQLPADYLQAALDGSFTIPLLLVTGRQNGVFTDSNPFLHQLVHHHRERKTTKWTAPVDLKIFEHCGHMDVFMGKNASNTFWPTFIEFIDKYQSTDPNTHK